MTTKSKKNINTKPPIRALMISKLERQFPKKVLSRQARQRRNTIMLVSTVWLVIGLTIVTFMVNSQAQYNRGVYDGMTRTKSILQGK